MVPDEDIYMVQPEVLLIPNLSQEVCKLQRSIYGLKQASRSWNKRFDEEIKRFGFDQNLDEPCVYQKASGSNVTFLILYVDDIIIMGEAAFILGIKIYKDRSKRLIRLSQNAYMDKILKRYKNDEFKRGHFPCRKIDLNKSQALNSRVDCYCNTGFEIDIDDIKSLTGYIRFERKRRLEKLHVKYY
ncbi:retrotransposon protein, putative, ty1-copia subclass [Tanacetum coccineum]